MRDPILLNSSKYTKSTMLVRDVIPAVRSASYILETRVLQRKKLKALRKQIRKRKEEESVKENEEKEKQSNEPETRTALTTEFFDSTESIDEKINEAEKKIENLSRAKHKLFLDLKQVLQNEKKLKDQPIAQPLKKPDDPLAPQMLGRSITMSGGLMMGHNASMQMPTMLNSPNILSMSAPNIMNNNNANNSNNNNINNMNQMYGSMNMNMNNMNMNNMRRNVGGGVRYNYLPVRQGHNNPPPGMMPPNYNSSVPSSSNPSSSPMGVNPLGPQPNPNVLSQVYMARNMQSAQSNRTSNHNPPPPHSSHPPPFGQPNNMPNNMPSNSMQRPPNHNVPQGGPLLSPTNRNMRHSGNNRSGWW